MTENLALSSRTAAQLRNQYETEKALANRLRNSSRIDRRRLYQTLYDELYRRVPDHPMLTRKATPEETADQVNRQMRYLSGFLRPGMTVLEIGAGDCALSFAIARKVTKVLALEVSKIISEQIDLPDNFELIISDGLDVPVPESSVDLVYSNNVMEHLHPEDALEQLNNICRVLKPGGMYLCTTPHRLQGPTDISGLFDDEPTCLHLKEYTFRELSYAFQKAGFDSTAAYINKSGAYHRIPISWITAFESISFLLFGRKRYAERQRWISRRPFTMFLQGISITGQKQIS